LADGTATWPSGLLPRGTFEGCNSPGKTGLRQRGELNRAGEEGHGEEGHGEEGHGEEGHGEEGHGEEGHASWLDSSCVSARNDNCASGRNAARPHRDAGRSRIQADHASPGRRFHRHRLTSGRLPTSRGRSSGSHPGRGERELSGPVGRRTSDPDCTDKWHRPNRPGIGENLSGTRPIVDSELLETKAGAHHPPYPRARPRRSPATS
jgi:hypothetical protein